MTLFWYYKIFNTKVSKKRDKIKNPQKTFFEPFKHSNYIRNTNSELRRRLIKPRIKWNWEVKLRSYPTS